MMNIEAVFEQNFESNDMYEIEKEMTYCEKTQKKLNEINQIITRSPVVIFNWKNKHKWPVEFVSGNVEKLFGYSAEDFTTGRIAYEEVIFPDDLRRVMKEVSVKCEDIESKEFEHEPYRIITKTGEIKWIDDRTYILRNDKGEITHFQGIVLDITKRKLIEESLRKSKEKYRLLTENTNDIVLSIDTKGIINYIGPQVLIYGYKPEEVISKNFIDFILPKDRMRVNESYQNALATGEEIPTYLRILDKNGIIHCVEEFGKIQYDEFGKIIGKNIVLRDITERKQLEEERAKFSRLESIGLLAGGIAHDFNNILSAILGNTSLAKLKLENKNELIELLTETENATLRASKLTQQLLTFAKGGTPVKETAELSELIRETTSFSLRGSNVKYRSLISPDLKVADVDKGQFSQVIGNIVINAKQAMPNGGTIYIKAENVFVSYRGNLPLSAGNYIKISISDKGHGIPEEFLSKIFEPYITLRPDGNGLGLATAYSIVHRHNGHITVESEVGVGTTFHLYFPASMEVLTNQENTEEDSEITTGRILVMDDEISIRKVVKMMLESVGNEVEVADDGEEAIKLYKKAMDSGKPFDAVIMDLTIPGAMGGKEAIKRILEINPLAKAIVSSGYSNDPVISNYVEYGFCEYIPKPYRLKELKKTMNKVLNM